jgi:hypothetical protein
MSSHAFFVDDREFKAGNNSLALWQWHTGHLRFSHPSPCCRLRRQQGLGWDVVGMRRNPP